jgi:hypothetical protein
MNIGNWLELGMAIWALIVIPRAIWRAWTRPPEGSMPTVDLTNRRQPSGWSIRGELARLFLVPVDPDDMSSAAADQPSREAADPGVSQSVNSASAPIAMPSSAVSGELTADEAAARAIAELLNAGLLTNRTKAIERVFHCSVTAKSRPDTPYQKALKLVEQYQAPAGPEYRPLDDEHRTVLELDQVKR